MIQLKNISLAYGEHQIFHNLNLDIADGEFVAIVGKSGSGKTSLLNIIALLEKPNQGYVLIDGKKYTYQRHILRYHRSFMSFLLQNFALIDEESVAFNLQIAAKFAVNPDNPAQDIASALKQVNLPESILSQKVYQLSGGEQQRVALARLLIKDAKYILADEPTGNLDQQNSRIVFEILQLLNKLGRTIIMVTHDENLAQQAKRIIEI